MKKLPVIALAASLWLSPETVHGEPTLVPAFTALSEPNPSGLEVREGDGVYRRNRKAPESIHGDVRLRAFPKAGH